jgi:hypothetical protein
MIYFEIIAQKVRQKPLRRSLRRHIIYEIIYCGGMNLSIHLQYRKKNVPQITCTLYRKGQHGQLPECYEQKGMPVLFLQFHATIPIFNFSTSY